MRSSAWAFGLATQTVGPRAAAAEASDGTPGSETTLLISPYPASIIVTVLFGGPFTAAARLPTSAIACGTPCTWVQCTAEVAGSICATLPSAVVTQTLPAQTTTAVGCPPSRTNPDALPPAGSIRTTESASAIPAPP